MVGRFVDHDGRAANNPSVRFGNISVMPVTGIEQPTRAKIESYCLDVHSRTGYSGSPIYVFRTVGGDLNLGNPSVISSQHQFVRLLGVHWGQFPEKWKITPTGRVKLGEAERRFIGEAEIDGLSGMTCATPSWAVLELMKEKKITDLIESQEQEIAARDVSPRAEGE
jgi:hypothetical protein